MMTGLKLTNPCIKVFAVSFNYRILFGALYTKDKFKYRNNKDMDCLLCKMKKESIIHVYTECEYTNSIFNDFCKVNNIVRVNNFDDIIYLKSDSAEEREKISIFKLIIWKMRMRAFRNQGHGKDVFYGYFKTLYNKLSLLTTASESLD